MSSAIVKLIVRMMPLVSVLDFGISPSLIKEQPYAHQANKTPVAQHESAVDSRTVRRSAYVVSVAQVSVRCRRVATAPRDRTSRQREASRHGAMWRRCVTAQVPRDAPHDHRYSPPSARFRRWPRRTPACVSRRFTVGRWVSRYASFTVTAFFGSSGSSARFVD